MANKGKKTRVQAIRNPGDIKTIRELLKNQPRNLAMFTLGINSALRASDLLAIRVSQIRDIHPGGYFQVMEKKTGKLREVTLNRSSHKAIREYMQGRRETSEDAPLFLSREGASKRLTVRHLNWLVKSWCARINLPGRYGSHSLRKTFGYHQRVRFKTDLPTLMKAFNHSTQEQTLTYLGVQAEDVRAAFMNEI